MSFFATGLAYSERDNFSTQNSDIVKSTQSAALKQSVEF